MLYRRALQIQAFSLSILAHSLGQSLEAGIIAPFEETETQGSEVKCQRLQSETQAAAKTSLWVLWFQAQSPSYHVSTHRSSGKNVPPVWRASAWDFGEKTILNEPGRFVWVVKVGAGWSGGGDSCPRLQPSESSLAWFLVWGRGPSPQGQGLWPCVEEAGGGERRAGVKAAAASCFVLGQILAALGLSLYRKWGFLLCWGLGLGQDQGEPGLWGKGRNERFRTGPWCCRIVPVSTAWLLWGQELAVLFLGAGVSQSLGP